MREPPSETEKEALRVSGCLGKHRFVSPQAARRMLRNTNWRGKTDPKVQPYRCSHCGGFHIGR